MPPAARSAVSLRTVAVNSPAILTLPRLLGDDAVDTLRDRIYDLLIEPGTRLSLDASRVEDISPAGVGVLIAAALLAQRTRSTLQIAEPSDTLRRILARHQHVAEILDPAV